MHVLVTKEAHAGWAYGMLCCLEEEIIRQTGARRLVVRDNPLGLRLTSRFRHGTRYAPLRRWLPKPPLALPDEVEVAWHVMMGPENCCLDLYKHWAGKCLNIVYIFDTLPSQMRIIRQVFSGSAWDVCVTSFDDAIPPLEQATGRPWLHADQAVTLDYFSLVPPAGRTIHFSSYGRRHPRVHAAVIRFCAAHGLYYDYTTHDCNHPTADPLSLFRQFAWHLSHSRFTFCWPVEVTSPGRAGDLSPITCRWFEAAAAGAVVLGQAPRNPRFPELFGEDFVTPINPEADLDTMVARLEQIWRQRDELSARAARLRQSLGERLDWADRVKKMLAFLPSGGRKTP